MDSHNFMIWDSSEEQNYSFCIILFSKNIYFHVCECAYAQARRGCVIPEAKITGCCVLLREDAGN